MSGTSIIAKISMSLTFNIPLENHSVQKNLNGMVHAEIFWMLYMLLFALCFQDEHATQV